MFLIFFYFKRKTTSHKWLCFFFCQSQPVLLENHYLFEAGSDIKWCHKVFDMNSLEICFKSTQPFLCSARGPCSKLALRDRIFLVIIIFFFLYFTCVVWEFKTCWNLICRVLIHLFYHFRERNMYLLKNNCNFKIRLFVRAQLI